MEKEAEEEKMIEKKVSWLELFFDLVFVTAVSYTTHLLIGIEDRPSRALPYYLGEYLLMVFPMFWLWTGQTMFINRFGQHLSRPGLFMLPQMFFFILMTASFDFNFDHTYESYLLSYLGLRCLTLIQYYLISRPSPRRAPRPDHADGLKPLSGTGREVAVLLWRLFLPGLLLVATSCLFSDVWRYVVMYAGIGLDMMLPLFFSRHLGKAPVHLGHLTERFALFVLITFGEALVSITNVLAGHTTDDRVLILALAGFAVICLLWGSYFQAYEAVIDRQKKTNGQLLLYGHFFILISVMLLAGAIEVLAEDHLPSHFSEGLLFGAVFLFTAAWNAVFYHHRKTGRAFSLRRAALMMTGLLLAWVFSRLVGFSALTNLLMVAGVVAGGLLAQAAEGRES